jgi:organic radical activating enzyme
MSDSTEELLDFKKWLDSTSPSFCLAKWKQVTLHLQTGLTHSCHHPTPHIIPVGEILKNPAALHNTEFKKQQRKLMLEGERPAECDYCWRVEDNATANNTQAVSDRVYKSRESWAEPYYKESKYLPWQSDATPSYLEVSFSNVCNFKCSYCGPQFSSVWMSEIQETGPYPTSGFYNNITQLEKTKTMPIPQREHNPYVEAFWRWWPEVYPKLHHFRITGGEPLLSKDTFQALDYIIENPNPELELGINSNMCVPDQAFEKFLEKVKIICSEKKVKKLTIFTSCDTQGPHAEYIRDGMDYDKWLSNCRRVLAEIPEHRSIIVMSTYNFLSLLDYRHFLEDILVLKNEFGGPEKDIPIVLDIPYLRQPFFLSVFIAPFRAAKIIENQITFMYKNKQDASWHETANMGFYQFEIDKLKRIYEMVRDNPIHKIDTCHKDFVNFIEEYDRRRGKNFLEVFPKLKETFNNWKNNGTGAPL